MPKKKKKIFFAILWFNLNIRTLIPYKHFSRYPYATSVLVAVLILINSYSCNIFKAGFKASCICGIHCLNSGSVCTVVSGMPCVYFTLQGIIDSVFGNLQQMLKFCSDKTSGWEIEEFVLEETYIHDSSDSGVLSFNSYEGNFVQIQSFSDIFEHPRAGKLCR